MTSMLFSFLINLRYKIKKKTIYVTNNFDNRKVGSDNDKMIKVTHYNIYVPSFYICN